MENLSEEETILNFPSGNYSVTGFWINLERKVMSHFLQIFLPSGSFVMVSWISFLMPLDAGERAGKVFQRQCKVNSVEEACAKCFAVHILEFEILQIT